MAQAINQTQFNLPGLKDLYKGKVRDVYNINDEYLVMVVTDRISAFDIVLFVIDSFPIPFSFRCTAASAPVSPAPITKALLDSKEENIFSSTFMAAKLTVTAP